MPTLPVPRLAALLYDNARGVYATEAATRLLVGHETWLHRSDFLAACVWTGTEAIDIPVEIAGNHANDPRLRAAVDWSEIPRFVETAPCSGSEERILRLVAELAGYDTGTPLAELLFGLDDHNGALVLDAIAHALHIRPEGGR
jgi:hypothetical protein